MIGVIPEHVLFSQQLSPQAKLLFTAYTFNCRAIDELAARFNVLQSTVTKWDKELEQAGLSNDGYVTLDQQPFVPVEVKEKKQKVKHTLAGLWGNAKFEEYAKEVFKYYPRRKGRLQTKAQAIEWINVNIHENMTLPVLQAVKNYAASDEAQRGFACDPIRFFRNKRWLDYLDAPEKEVVRLKTVL